MEKNSILNIDEIAPESGLSQESLLTNISPEICTPINGIIRIVQLLKKTALTDEQWQMVNLLEISSNSLLTVINEALTLSKKESEI